MAKKGLPATEKIGLPPVTVPSGHLIGAHMSIAGGSWKALERAQALGATATQLFVKNNNRWEGKVITEAEAKKFREMRAELNDMPCVAHNCYLINMASPKEDHFQKSISAMVDEVERCELLGVEELVVHPGAHVGSGLEAGIERIAQALEAVFERTPKAKTRILLETTAGQGSSIGHEFEHLAAILERFPDHPRLGVCLDTAHIFAAGYDIRTAADCRKTFDEFDRVVGVERLHALHMNDTKKDFNTRVDRHEAIGKGFIGLEGFRWIMSAPKLLRIPKLLETPKGDSGEKDWENIQALIDCI